MLWDIFVWPQDSETKEWGCYIEVDASEAESLLRHLKRHKLRSKIAIKLLEDEGKEGTTVWAGWGPGVESLLGHESDANPETEPSILASLPDPRAGNSADSPPFAYRFLLRGDEVPANLSVPVIDPEQYRLRRYLYGVPEGPVEIPRESALPMENNIDLAGGIDFRKGCYVGQELTIRTKHTGVVRKRVLPVQLYRATEPAPGPSDMTEHDNQFPHFDPDWQTAQTPIEVPADIKQLDEDGGLKKVRTRGKLIAQMGNVGLAMCRLENMTPMQVSAEGGSYTPGVEFALQGASPEETPVRVKAFLPYWLVTRERQLWDKSPGASGRTAGTE
jgi:folate-binding protein YgfZ